MYEITETLSWPVFAVKYRVYYYWWDMLTFMIVKVVIVKVRLMSKTELIYKILVKQVTKCIHIVTILTRSS